MKVLVIGDVIVDRYIYGTAERLSPEAPVPVVRHQTTFDRRGGAGNLYENLKSLGVNVELLDLSQPKCIKTRVFCDGHYVTRIDQDYQTNGYDVLETVERMDFSEYAYVVLSDYAKGVLYHAKEIIAHINKYNCKVIVDPKRQASAYEGAWLVKPNAKEYEEMLFNKWQGNIITTRADKSVNAVINGQEFCVFPQKVDVADVTGAGDCFLAAFVYALTSGKDYQTCLEIAVKGATESVKHVGTYVLKSKDLHEVVVFTNGVFDILHKGHFELLKQARSLGTRLVVGINSDASVKRLKGESRPINNELTRVEQLEALPWVDKVFVFDDDTPYNLIKRLKPALIVKGGDYTVETVVGHDLAPVHIVPTVEGYSTTKIIEASKCEY
jgi:D-beta-D-heptose 7-phosphate kinase / D-beta-D-heptose 1-phosphate adenosyltransferase